MEYEPGMRPEAILFDAGGTVVLQEPILLSRLLGHPVALPEMHEAHYRAMDAYARRRAAGEDLAWIWWQEHFFNGLGYPEPARGATLTNNGYGLWSMAIAGALRAIEELDRLGIRRAVVSNSDGSARESLQEAGFDGMFEFVIDSHELGVAKPDPRIFWHTLELLGVPAGRAWYVGDSIYHDMAGAEAAGLGRAVLIDPYALAPEHEPRISSVAELPELVRMA
jgi:FMN phosphatase YigB (HAD superfamily)